MVVPKGKWFLTVALSVAFSQATLAFDLARELAKAKPGAVIDLPAGTFSGGVDVPPGVTLRGAGYRDTFVECRGGAAALRVKGAGARIENLTVLNSGTGIDISSAEDVVVRRVMVVGGSMGISARDVEIGSLER